MFFSYGMILYALQIPFAEIKNDIRVCYLLMEGKRPSIPVNLPPFLHPVIQDCWSKEPNQRPSFQRITKTIRTEAYEKDEPDF